MGLLSLLGKVYGGENPWSVKSTETISPKEAKSIRAAVVVEGKFGNQVCFMLASGGTQYASLSRDSELEVGEEFPVAGAKFITLEREGDADIVRVQEA